MKPAGSRIFSKSQIYHSIPLALDLPRTKLQNAGSMQMHWFIWLVCTFIAFFFSLADELSKHPFSPLPHPPPPHPPRFGWSCNEDLKHQTLERFDLYPAFFNKFHRLFSFSFSLSSVASSSSPALLSKSHIQYVSHHFDTKLKLWFHSNLGTFFFLFSFVKMHFHTCSPYYSLVKRKLT